ncbi:MarR family winged helix-turn-helix transcriptional regulator [Paenibacillus daejeonensis]|uniref:MarR family winged helix-turn-helix transcriptional regulator n=1 Tax=Paenibacillus daejeonensis TaxID=135193 RepID=UPI00036C89F2|nr:MarR family transcriptional regulator [Paenibacillus daejeonensis]
MPTTEQSLELFRLFKTLIKKANDAWNRNSPDSLTISQFRMLHILASQGKHKVAELADLLQVTSGAVTGMADRMIRFGLITRFRDEADRRVVYLEITQEGIRRKDELGTIYHTLFARVFEQISEEDKAHLQRIFTHMHDLLEFTDKE